MKDMHGFQYAELVFDKQARATERASFDELLAKVGSGPADVIVFVHGWNNDMGEARGWYDELAKHFRAAMGPTADAYILGVLWPSKKWADRKLIPGGAASAQGPATTVEVLGRLDELKGFFDADDADDRLEAAKAFVSKLEDSPANRKAFVDMVRTLLPPEAATDADDYAAELGDLDGAAVLQHFKAPIPPEVDRATGGSAGGMKLGGCTPEPEEEAGGAAGLGFSLSGFTAAAERLLNMTTYYQMKARAGTVGVAGLNPALRELRKVNPKTRLHLVGHSFGGRLVTAATVGRPEDPGVEPDTLTLLQAAFSHYGFAENYRKTGKDGFFRRLVTDGMTRGPVVITHSRCDKAVGYAYPLASRLAGQDAAGLGDADSRFGGIGRNGAQDTPGVVPGRLLGGDGAYDFEPGKLYNLNADEVIGNHSDIRRAEVARAVVAAMQSVPVP